MSDIIILDDESNAKKPKVDKVDNVNGHAVNNSLGKRLNDYFLGFQKINIKQKVLFFRLLAVMLNSGITLMKSVMILEKQEKNVLMKNMLKVFLEKLKEGKTLSDCMSLYNASFAESEVGMINSGEKTGKLNETLVNMAEQVEKISSIIGKLKAALTYPAMIMLVVIGVISVMMIKVVPKLLEIFDNKASLPPSTQALIAVSDFFKYYWWLVIIVGFVIFVGIGVWKKTEYGAYYLDNLKLKIPKFGGIYKRYLLSKFARTFSSLITAGVSVVESLRICSTAVGNEVYRQRLLLLTEDVKQGMKIWESIDGDPLFPDMMVQMIQVGEQTANLDKTIVKVADFYDEQFENTIGSINKLLEPIIIVFLAVTVGFIAVAIMQPIMNMSDTISNG